MMNKQKIVKIVNIVTIVVILVVATVIGVSRGSYRPDFNLVDMRLNVTGPEGTEYSVPFDEIAVFELLEDYTIDTSLETNNKYGTIWCVTSDEKGNPFTLIVLDKVNVYIRVVSKDNRVLIYNYESAGSTRDTFNSFRKYLVEKNYITE